MKPIIITGFPRSGTTLLYCMLRYAVDGYKFLERESPDLREDHITKSPSAIFDMHPRNADRCIIMMRNPRAILTSKHPGEKFRNAGYFISAHSHASNATKGLCEWWTAIKKFPQAMVVYYEMLVDEPSTMQQRLADRFGLTYRDGRRFEDFHLEPHGDEFEVAMHGCRPLQRRSIFDEARIAEQFHAHPELTAVTQEMGYPV